MEEMVNRAKAMAERVASREAILPFLRVCGRNSHLSLLNQLLVYEQCSEAKTVCGKNAWKHLGRTVRANAAAIQILLPDVSMEKPAGYRVVEVYDYGDTEGDGIEENHKKSAFADRITQITGATWEMVPEVAVADKLERGFYDGEKHIFYLAEQGTGQQEQTILRLYVDYVLDSREHKNMLVKMAVSFLLYERYGLKHTIVSALFGKLGKILVSGDAGVVNRVFEQAEEKAGNEDLREELLALKEKLLQTREGYLEELYRKRCQRQLFSFPPVALEMEAVDIFKEERMRYGAERVRDFADAGRRNDLSDTKKVLICIVLG